MGNSDTRPNDDERACQEPDASTETVQDLRRQILDELRGVRAAPLYSIRMDGGGRILGFGVPAGAAAVTDLA